ncbi:MAG: hypothetical protein V1767_00685 [Chloroflexota bacterium]
MSDKKENRAKEQARMQLDGIVIMMKRLNHIDICENGNGSEPCDLTDKDLVEGIDEYWKDGQVITDEEREEYSVKYHDEDQIRESINEDPLSIEFRGGWHTPGEITGDEEYKILLCTGGPAVQITGDLDNGQAHNARLEYQDWFTPWTDYFEFKNDERDLLLQYAQQFCYEG